MDVGTTIKQFRKKIGVNQQELADKSNITQAYLSQIENNKKDPNLSTLAAIADSLGVPLPILFFSSVSESDVPEHKKEAYAIMAPAINEMISSLFLNGNAN